MKKVRIKALISDNDDCFFSAFCSNCHIVFTRVRRDKKKRSLLQNRNAGYSEEYNKKVSVIIIVV